MRTLSIIVLVLCAVYVLLSGYVGKPIEGPSPEMREYFKYIVAAVLVAFIGYLAMSRH